MKKKLQWSILIDEEDFARVERYSEHLDISKAELLRRLIKSGLSTYDKLAGEQIEFLIGSSLNEIDLFRERLGLC